MKLTKAPIFSLILLAFLFTSCGGHNPIVKTSFYENREEFPFYKNPELTDKYFCFIRFEYPDSIIGIDNESPGAVEKMRKSLLEGLLGEEYVTQNYKGDVKEILSVHDRECRKSLRHNTVEVYNTGNVGNWSSFIIYEFEEGKYEVEKGICFDLRTGETASENDLFKWGYKKHLRSLIYRNLIRTCPVVSIRQKQLEDKISEGSFILKNNSIIYLFPSGSVAPQSEGPVRVAIDMKDIEKYLR